MAWPFLFIICSVPLVFMWSDKIVDLFPALSTYLPAKTGKAHPASGAVVVNDGGANAGDGAPGLRHPGDWAETSNGRGYVAWTRSTDGNYRIVVGCRPQEAAGVQLIQDNGQPLFAPHLTLNYRYGTLTLDSGFYKGADVVGAVAQFKDVYVQTPAGVVAAFTLDSVRSNAIARALQSYCAQ